MKSLRWFGGFAAAAVAVVGLGALVAYAQAVTAPLVVTMETPDVVQIVPNGVPGPTNYYANQSLMQSWILSGNATHTGKPVLTSCITGGGTIAGTDTAFLLTGGSTASTTCTATFSNAWAKRPICTVSSETAYATTTPSFTVSTTALVITQASESSEVYDVICAAQNGNG
jgi:hypothetical protein